MPYLEDELERLRGKLRKKREQFRQLQYQYNETRLGMTRLEEALLELRMQLEKDHDSDHENVPNILKNSFGRCNHVCAHKENVEENEENERTSSQCSDDNNGNSEIEEIGNNDETCFVNKFEIVSDTSHSTSGTNIRNSQYSSVDDSEEEKEVKRKEAKFNYTKDLLSEFSDAVLKHIRILVSRLRNGWEHDEGVERNVKRENASLVLTTPRNEIDSENRETVSYHLQNFFSEFDILSSICKSFVSRSASLSDPCKGGYHKDLLIKENTLKDHNSDQPSFERRHTLLPRSERMFTTTYPTKVSRLPERTIKRDFFNFELTPTIKTSENSSEAVTGWMISEDDESLTNSILCSTPGNVI